MTDTEGKKKDILVEKNSGYVLGIDLGTTNSAVAVYKGGDTEIINIDGTKTMPSVISVLRNGEILVGAQAKSRSLIDPENTVTSVKRQMAKDWKKEFEGLSGKEYTPTDISAEILAKLISGVQQNESVDLDGSPKYAVICVPANFDDAQKKETKKAAELANLDVLWLLEEPVAAAYSYALERERDQTILVYDLGGGTFDVSVLQVNSTESESKSFKVLSKEGIQELGGDDFDQKLMMIVADKLKETSEIDILDLKKDQGISEKKLREAQQKLKEAVMTAKHELTESSDAKIDLPNLIHDEGGKPHHVDMEVTREQFNEQIRDLILQTKEAVQKSLDNAELTIGDIDRIILVGGSTKVPMVKEVLQEMFGREPYSDTDPDTAIARGAAILGATLNLPEVHKEPEFIIVIENKVTHNLGIEVVGGKFSCLIEKGREISPGEGPVSETNEYTTPRDNMTELAIRVYQTPEDDVEYVSSEGVKCIGEFFLTRIPAKPKGQERITVTFEIDDQNLLKVRANSSSSSKELEIKES
ncbi:MAG: Hsp70 family protein [Desulfobacterales bacterium]|nr:Hsp70 family protein [Desulfobacterales bacterium]